MLFKVAHRDKLVLDRSHNSASVADDTDSSTESVAVAWRKTLQVSLG